MSFSLPVMFLGTLLFETGQWEAIQNATGLHWAALVYTAVVSSLVGHGLFFVLVQRHPVPLLMPYMLLMTPMAGFFGVVVWGDRPNPELIVGALVVLLSILFITLRGRSRARANLKAKKT